MKYSIDGLEKSKTVKDINIVEGKFIEVRYLDGGKDVIEYTKEKLEKVIEIMTVQAKRYVSTWEGYKLNINAVIGFFNILVIIFCIAMIISLIAMNVGFIIGCAAMTALTEGVVLKIKSEKKYYEKYALYLENNFQEIINKYRGIIDKEKTLGKKISKSETKKTNLKNIATLDEYSLQDLREIQEKVSRYMELVGQEIVSDEEFEGEKGKQKVKK